MNNLLIIGNGFDLDLGLLTKYSDFIESKYFQEYNKRGNKLFRHISGVYRDKKWIDIENELKTFALNDKGKGTLTNKTKDEFEMLRTSLCDYLSDLKHDHLKKDSSACILITSIINNYLFNKLYTYNYTNLENILNILNIKEGFNNRIKIEYVHGKADDKSIILGFEDSAEVKDKYLFMIKSFSRHFRSHNIQYDMINADEVIFFGHSLGSTDYHYFERFFRNQSDEQMKMGESKKITIFTFDNKSRLEILAQLRNMNEKKTNLLFSLNQLNIFCTKDEEGDKERIKEYCEYLRKEGLIAHKAAINKAAANQRKKERELKLSSF
ncbi:bacteriophage abortive infection AbiH family protein [Candidatus Bacteroides intestinigallinarum]|uniref:bacteriophage abortive infection AbiH family protein n=1 Tax=Candidatus Bacteroides intestinigallinarum TaxID=2838470 RepID=UPI0021655BC5|nr:bacteriophage abortive infection AbiH family protein [Candidatus Bacteroides intestinigallinarum]MCS3202991.1 bacteriophage abortive infection AbiH family protein [Candidatus Bacteroides intestinigallinarum]